LDKDAIQSGEILKADGFGGQFDKRDAEGVKAYGAIALGFMGRHYVNPGSGE